MSYQSKENLLPKIFYRKKFKSKEDLNIKIAQLLSTSIDAQRATGEETTILDSEILLKEIEDLIKKYCSEDVSTEKDLRKNGTDFIFIFLGLVSVSWLFGFFTGLSDSGISYVYILSLTIIVAIFSAMDFKLEFSSDKIKIGTISSQSSEYEINPLLIGLAVVCFTISTFNGFGHGRKFNDYGVFNFSLRTGEFSPYSKEKKSLSLGELESPHLSPEETKQWVEYSDTLDAFGYDSTDINQMVKARVSYNKELQEIENANKVLKSKLDSTITMSSKVVNIIAKSRNLKELKNTINILDK